MLRRLSIRLITVVCIAFTSNTAFATGKPVGFIDTPDTCFVAQKVTATEIYLAAVGKCEGKVGRVFVELQPGETRTIVADGQILGKQSVKALEVADVSGLLETGKKAADGMKLPGNPYNEAMEKVAQQTSDVYYSQEFQDKLKTETERIKTVMLGDQMAGYYPEAAPGKTDDKASLASDERLYVFISSSMPVSVLRTYAADIAKLKDTHIVLVMRGFINGMEKVAPTISFFAEVLKKQPDCEIGPGKQCAMREVNLIVDPLLFRKYHITQVPSFVFVKGVQFSKPDLSEGNEDHISQQGTSYMITGDGKLSYVLTQLSKSSKSATLERMGRESR